MILLFKVVYSFYVPRDGLRDEFVKKQKHPLERNDILQKQANDGQGKVVRIGHPLSVMLLYEVSNESV